jgi:predicted acetyltransferase
MNALDYAPVADDAELDALIALLMRSFGDTRARWDAFVARVGRANLRRVRSAGRIIGGLAIYRAGQFWGGRAVPFAGIAAVGVAPEDRAGGVAARLMTAALEELRAAEVPLVGLYASTAHLYRAVGFEQAGHSVRYEVAMKDLVRGAGDRTLPMRAVDPQEHAQFHALYRERARRANGHLDRDHAFWERVTRSPVNVVHAAMVGPDDAPEGYVVYAQPPEIAPYDLTVKDWAWLTPRAAHRLLAFFADQRSLGKDLKWSGAAADPMLGLLPEATWKVERAHRWFLRVAHLERALALRGYAPGAEGELHLDVTDAQLPANAGRYVLRVRNGAASLERGGRGDLKCDARGLAPLYSGFLPPAELRAIGWIDGPDAALETASRIFAGPEPWMPEIF